MKLLVIDDDKRFTSSLYYLFYKSYTVHIAPLAEIALAKLRENIYDLILLDMNLPDSSGSDLYHSIRTNDQKTPIVVVSGSNDLRIKVNMLSSGASDYITKPIYAEELRARIALHTKKPSEGMANRTLFTHDLVLDTTSRMASRNGRPIFLRPREYALLECLLLNAGKAVSRELLMQFVWEGNVITLPNNVHVQINSLRKKIDDGHEIQLIQTVHRVGYRIVKLPASGKT